jgi:hypothetical protein
LLFVLFIVLGSDTSLHPAGPRAIVQERSQCVLVDLGAGCQFDDASMTSSQLGGGVFIVLTLYANPDHHTQAHQIWYHPS